MAFQIRVGCADAAIVRLLLELRRCGKVLLDLNHGELGVLPMLYACRIYRDGPEDAVPFIYDTVTSVVDAGADVNARDVHGKTALHLLCQSSAKHLPEALKLFSYLLGAGADWRLQDDLGNTALHDAATWGSDPIIKHILAVGAGDEALHYRNSHGETALHTALSEEYWYATIKSTKLLLDAGFCPNAVNHKGRSAAHLAALNRPWHEIGDFNSIVATNYNLRLKDNEGNPPFHYAVASRVPWGYPYTAGSLEETLRFYFNRGADLHDSCEECAAQRWRC
jgi:ankyrin repeat protein